MPVPFMNVINGGCHAGNLLGMQEFMIIPNKAKSFTEGLRVGCEVYHTLKQILRDEYGPGATLLGDEGGFAPTGISNHVEALDILMMSIERSGHKGSVGIAIDVAASELKTEDGMYDLNKKHLEETKKLSSNELCAIYENIVKNYPVESIEDPFDENDWAGFTEVTRRLGSRVQIVGDDLLVTNPKRISQAASMKACNALLLKMNQIGSVSESLDAWRKAKESKWNTMVSHRSGETEDPFIADLCVGLGAGQIKTGAPARSERLAKYNQLLRIEYALGNTFRYGS